MFLNLQRKNFAFRDFIYSAKFLPPNVNQFLENIGFDPWIRFQFFYKAFISTQRFQTPQK